jgi:hypothetical protein
MINNMSDRFNKLRELREELCKKNNNWSEVFTLRDWLIQNLKDLVKQSESDNITKEDVINMLEDLICVVEPEEQNEK